MNDLQGQIDAVLTTNTIMYNDGKMTKENYNAVLDSLAMVFGAEYIGSRMIFLGLIQK